MAEQELSQFDLAVLAAKLSMDTVKEQQRELAKLRGENARLKQLLIRAATKGKRRGRT